jgi:hypothetical protein
MILRPLAPLVLLALFGPAQAQDDVANFYRGKQVRLIVGTAAGGGYGLFAAFNATMRDQAFIADAARLQLDIDPKTGEEVQSLVAQLAQTSPEIVTRVRAALEAPAAR